MDNKVIKSWDYKIGSCRYKVEQFGRQIIHHLDTTSTEGYSIEQPIAQYLCTTALQFPVEIEKELMDSVLEHYQANQLNEEQEQHWRFWKNLDRSKIPKINYSAALKKNSATGFLELSPLGMKTGFSTYKRKHYKAPFRLN